MMPRSRACRVMRGRVKRAGAALWRNESGNVILEFALVMPMLLTTILAILHTCLIFFAQQALETAAETAARTVMTGTAQTSITGNVTVNGVSYSPAQQFLMRACAALPPVMSGGSTVLQAATLPNGSTNTNTCPKLYVSVASANSFSGAVTAAGSFGTNAYTTGGANASSQTSGSLGSGTTQIVAVKLMYLWPTFSGIFGLRLTNQSGGNRLLTASSVLLTESYT